MKKILLYFGLGQDGLGIVKGEGKDLTPGQQGNFGKGIFFFAVFCAILIPILMAITS